MSRPAITFDFHDTLVHCPAWFQLEVHSLVSDFLRWQDERRGTSLHPDLPAAADLRYRALRRAIMHHGHELSADRCVALVLAGLGVETSKGEIEAGVDELMRATLDDAVPVPGAAETVTAIADTGAPMAVVSSAVFQPFLEWALERFGMAQSFGAIVSSADAGFYKSRPEIFWVALGRVGAEPQGSVHVGDSYRFDVAGADAAGMRAVWLNGKGAVRDPIGPEPALILETLTGSAGRIVALISRS